MSGTHITDQQVRLYMNHRKYHTQELAAAKSGMSERTARRVEHDAGLPSQRPRRYWRSRPDPFADVWESEVVPVLRRLHDPLCVVARTLRDGRHAQQPGTWPRVLCGKKYVLLDNQRGQSSVFVEIDQHILSVQEKLI